MRTETISVLQFDELKSEIQEKVIEKYREDLDYPFLSDNLDEELNELLQKHKIKGEATIYYNLSYSQGSGCCFIGSFKWRNYNITIQHRSNLDYHKRTVGIYIETRFGNEAKESINQEFEQIYSKICDRLEESGYNYIEAEQESENIAENIRINEYEFLADGTRW